MNQFSRALVATFGFVLLGCVFLIVPEKSATGSDTKKPAGGHTENVNVVNTPLPVTGTVNVGTPTVNLGMGSTVGINGSVQIGNTATSPVQVRDVENPARRPIQITLCHSVSVANCDLPNEFVVPSGEEVVIEYVSGHCEGRTGTMAELTLDTTVGGGPQMVHSFNEITVGANHLTTFGQLTRIYADPSTRLSFFTQSDNPSRCFVTLSGHTVAL